MLGILGLIFITLKLTGLITWSWWWVLSPFLVIPIGIITVVAMAFLYAAVEMVVVKR